MKFPLSVSNMANGSYVWGSTLEGCSNTDLVRLKPYCGQVQKEDQDKPAPLRVSPVTSSGANKQDFIQKLEEKTELSIYNFQQEILSAGIVNLTATFGRHYFFKKDEAYEVSHIEDLTDGHMERRFCPGGIPRNIDFTEVLSDLIKGAVTKKKTFQYSVRLKSGKRYHIKQKEDQTFECCSYQQDDKFLTFTLHRAVSDNLDIRFHVRSANIGKEKPSTLIKFTVHEGGYIDIKPESSKEQVAYAHEETDVTIIKEDLKFTVMGIKVLEQDEESGLWKPGQEKDEVRLSIEVESDSYEEMVDAAKTATRNLVDICCNLDHTLFRKV